MTITHIDPALACAKAHEARRHRPLPPLDDLPLTDGDVPALDWRSPIAGVRWYEPRMLADAAAGVLILAGLSYLALVLT